MLSTPLVVDVVLATKKQQASKKGKVRTKTAGGVSSTYLYNFRFPLSLPKRKLYSNQIEQGEWLSWHPYPHKKNVSGCLGNF